MKKYKINVIPLNSPVMWGLGLLALALSACTPEGVINKTKYNGEKITNTCDQFKEEVQSLIDANNNSAQLVVAEYDNSDFDYYYLEPGQFEIKDGVLNFRFAQDLEFDKYLQKGVAVIVRASYNSLDHLNSLESPKEGDVGQLVVDRAYFDANKEPVFMYKMPIDGSDKDLNGKQIKLTFTVVKYNKKGELKKVFCNSDEVPLGPVGPACCTYKPWDKAAPMSIVEMPEVDIKDEKYKYRGFTGTLDFIFPENSVKFDKNQMTQAIQDYIKKYNEKGYSVTTITIDGWASLGGKEDLNQKLSERRAKVIYEDLEKALADSTINMSYAGKGEDWDRLALLTKASALSSEEQTEVLNVINGAGTLDEKEANMRKVKFWNKLVDEVIVNTRHTFVTFKFDYTPDKMYVEYYPSHMPIVSEDLMKEVVDKQMMISKYKDGDNVKAGLKVLDILIGNNKKANLYAMRSTYHFGSNNTQMAIDDIEQAVSLEKDNLQYALAALAYKTEFADNYTLDQRMEMLDMYNDYAVRFPNNSSLLFNRATMMDKVGYISGALVEYTDLLDGKEATAANLNNRGVAKLKTMRTTEAEADFMAALEKDANLAQAHFNMGLIYAYRGLTVKTVEHLQKAVAIDPAIKPMIWSNPAFVVMKKSAKFDVLR